MKDRENLADKNQRHNLSSGQNQGRSSADDPAKSKFFMIAAVRLGGGIMVMLGLLGINGGLPIPDIASYLLIALGLLEFFVLPTFLSKRWSSRNQ